MGNASDYAERRKSKSAVEFLERITALGGTVTGTFVDTYTKIECLCPNGHTCFPDPNSIRKGRGMCKVCVKRDPASAADKFKQRIELEIGGRLIGVYVNAMTKVEAICPNGHTCWPIPANVNSGRGMCSLCRVQNGADTKKKAKEVETLDRVLNLGGQVTGNYVGALTPLDCICPNGHPCNPMPASLQQGQGMCKRCVTRISKPEQEVYDWIVRISRYPVIQSYRKLFDDSREMDIWIPEISLGIEFNGSHWHSEEYLDRLYHQKKSLDAQAKEAFVYHIFEYQWEDPILRVKIESQLRNLFSTSSSVGARKCEVREVSNSDSRLFLDANHVQGNVLFSSVRLGLYLNNELVSLMTFGKPRFGRKEEWELLRFCSSQRVAGGASKLFTAFLRKYQPTSIVSYSDIARTKGGVYSRLGFKEESVSAPNYIWINNSGTYFSRYQTQVHRLHDQGFEGTEPAIMKARGFQRIYDSGNRVWVWNSLQ